LARLAACRRKEGKGDGNGGDGATKANIHTYAAQESHVDELVFNRDLDFSGPSKEDELAEAQVQRRLRKTVFRPDGEAIDLSKPSSMPSRQEGIKRIEQVIEVRKHEKGGSKRCFPWTHRPTAWENPVTYEDPPNIGTRPSHPTCSNGVVAKEHKRYFPEKAPATAIPPANMSKAPIGNEWGGWARNGAPGREVMDGPWQVEPRDRELAEGEEAEFRVSDARVKRFPEMKYNDTTWLTTWHTHSRDDVEPRRQTKYHLNVPIESCSPTCEDAVFLPAAGKTINLPAEGTKLDFYDRVRLMDQARAMTAR
jgi:hypothetical protein